MSVTMVATMPGDWPRSRTSMEDEQVVYHLQVPTIIPQLEIQISAPASSSRGSDELFFDTPHSATITDVSEVGMPSYLVFEPVVESVERNQHLDWWRYDPPSELFRVQEGTSEELRGLIPRSIERLRAQQAEEEERRAAAAREVRPLTRTTRTNVRQRRSVSEARTPVEHLDPLSEATEQPDARNYSATSLVSDDSGYASTGPDRILMALTHPEEPQQSTSTTTSKGKKGAFSFSSLFRRKDNAFSILSERPVGHRQGDASNTAHDHLFPQNPTSPIPEVLVSAASTETTECVSCLDDFNSAGMVKLTCHSYCPDCFRRLISTALETEAQWPAKCCLNPIPSETVLPQLDASTKHKYKQREAEWSIPTSDRIYCAHAGCNAWISPRRVHKQNGFARCRDCSKKTCTVCRGVAHEGIDCPQDPALQQTINLAEDEGWKRCYQCNAFVEHNQGCRHMTCRCKAEFCYICSARWRTCSCTDAQLATAQLQVLQRRHAREDEEMAAAAEIARREALAEEERILVQMVEDFERQEAERAAAAAEAQRLRDEEERRQREEERRRIEEERIAVIGARFRELTTELEGLNEVQRVFMIERYEFEVEVQRKERQDALDALSIRHTPELNAQASSSQKAISEAENAYKQEYRTRLAEEQRIEADYISQLQAFWAGKPDGELRVREARQELRGDQDKEYKFWDAYRKRQISALREMEKRKLEQMLARHAAEIKVVEGRAKIDAVEWKRKVSAEGKWVDAVVRERGSMLSEMEQVEYARV